MKRYTLIIPPEAKPSRGDKAVLRQMASLAAWQVRDAFARRDVKRNGQRISADTQVFPGDVLELFLSEDAPSALEIVFEDDDYVVVNKRQGMPTQGEGSVEAAYLRERGAAIMACHRLDVQTGGLLLLAKDDAAKEAAEAAFATHTVRKTYEAVVCGVPAQERATLRAYLRKDAKRAKVTIHDAQVPGSLPIETRYEVLTAAEDTARLSVEIITGRTHQIRAHLAHIGHPILGDDKYGNRAVNRLHGARRQQLWATRLVLWDGRIFEAKPNF